ncbi:hypothetical protein FHETE_1093 [Fusarium heterosporum]|uniref:Uncharacterized protein n=1 Tax=Fusarium heterosporum TaxID=42747 RepID=A0A8H5U075_FUSHE|nr:hypothetical protein FHETE_1093 [Fusarium heterosporum]
MGLCSSKSENSKVKAISRSAPPPTPAPPATHASSEHPESIKWTGRSATSGPRTRSDQRTAEYYNEYGSGYSGSYGAPSPHVDRWVSDVASRHGRGSIYDTRSQVVGPSHYSSSATGGRARSRPESSSDYWTARSRPPTTIYEYDGPPPVARCYEPDDPPPISRYGQPNTSRSKSHRSAARYGQSRTSGSKSYYSGAYSEESTKLGTKRSGDSTQLGEKRSLSVARSRGPTATTASPGTDEVWVVVDGGKAAEWYSKELQKTLRVTIE